MRAMLLATLVGQPLALDKVLLVGLYKDSGVSIRSFALTDESIPQLANASIGANPSWITAGPVGTRGDGELTSLFAVSETGDTVASLTMDCEGKLVETSRVSSQGAGPVFLQPDYLGEHLLVANYGGGTVAVLPMQRGADGTATLGEATQTMAFGATAHAHSVYQYFASDYVFVPTLGLDQVQQLSFQGGELSKALEPLTVPAQQGPRHLAFHPSLPIAVLANEGAADATVTIQLLAVDRYKGLSTIATYEASGPYSPPDMYPGEVLFSMDSRFVLVSVRDASEQKRDGVAVFKVEEEGASLSFVGYTIVGHYPRSMVMTDDDALLVVGNQKDNSLSFLSLNRVTGELIKARDDLSIGDSPAFVGVFETAKGCAGLSAPTLV